MFWVAAGIALFAGVVATMSALMKRPNDLGLLSDQWIAQHRGES